VAIETTALISINEHVVLKLDINVREDSFSKKDGAIDLEGPNRHVLV